MKAIVTKYLGPTNTRGARIKVSAEGVPSKFIPFDHGSNDPHGAAARAYAKSLEWSGDLEGGTLPSGEHVFVFCNRK